MSSRDLKIIIRQASMNDVPQMCGLLTDLFSIEADFTPDIEKQERGLRLLLEDVTRSLVLVAVKGDEVIGMCSVQTLISTSEGSPVGLVEDVIVRSDFRERGIGTDMLSKIFEWCENRGMTRVQLLADRDNSEALDFYASRGWMNTKLICIRKFTNLKGRQ